MTAEINSYPIFMRRIAEAEVELEILDKQCSELERLRKKSFEKVSELRIQYTRWRQTEERKYMETIKENARD
jgi:hypothetical protein